MSKKHDALRYQISGFVGNIVFDKKMTETIMSEGTYIFSDSSDRHNLFS